MASRFYLYLGYPCETPDNGANVPSDSTTDKIPLQSSQSQWMAAPISCVCTWVISKAHSHSSHTQLWGCNSEMNPDQMPRSQLHCLSSAVIIFTLLTWHTVLCLLYHLFTFIYSSKATSPNAPGTHSACVLHRATSLRFLYLSHHQLSCCMAYSLTLPRSVQMKREDYERLQSKNLLNFKVCKSSSLQRVEFKEILMFAFECLHSFLDRCSEHSIMKSQSTSNCCLQMR